MQGKVCCFFGHRDAPDTLVDDLYTTFLVGGHGNFDFLAAQTVRQLRMVYPHIRLVLVAAYASALCSPRVREGGFDEAFVPDTLAKVPFKAAIVCRNRWMAEQTDFVIAYVIRAEGGAYTAVEHARKKGKKSACYSKIKRYGTFSIPFYKRLYQTFFLLYAAKNLE